MKFSFVSLAPIFLIANAAIAQTDLPKGEVSCPELYENIERLRGVVSSAKTGRALLEDLSYESKSAFDKMITDLEKSTGDLEKIYNLDCVGLS